jgi:hypothetical protein
MRNFLQSGGFPPCFSAPGRGSGNHGSATRNDDTALLVVDPICRKGYDDGAGRIAIATYNKIHGYIQDRKLKELPFRAFHLIGSISNAM